MRLKMHSKMYIISLCIILLCQCIIPCTAAGDEELYAASYATYDTTYDDILKMYLRVMPVQCREQKMRRHDLYNEYMYYDIPMFLEGIDTEEYRQADEEGKKKIRSVFQEQSLHYMKNNIGYAILDLNGDGIDEMIIGMGHSYVFEVFTIDDGRIRELIKAGYRNSCNLLSDGTFLRYAFLGGGMDTNILFRMDGTNKVKFVKGYLFSEDFGYQNGLNSDDCWFRMNNANDLNATISKHVPPSEAKAWIAQCEASYANIHFIPFAAYEKGFSGDGVAVLSLKGKTSGNQKVRIRTKPDIKSKILAQKKVGTYITAIAQEGDYYKVMVDKTTGYVHKDYITILTALPEN